MLPTGNLSNGTLFINLFKTKHFFTNDMDAISTTDHVFHYDISLHSRRKQRKGRKQGVIIRSTGPSILALPLPLLFNICYAGYKKTSNNSITKKMRFNNKYKLNNTIKQNKLK